MDRREFWDRCHHVYDALNELDDYRGCLEDVTRQLNVRPGESVLDAGSGTGNLAILLAGMGARVTGMDFSAEALRAHRRKAPLAITIQASLEEPLPFPDRTFDHVACLSVLFAISEEGTRLALREFHRVLKPGGSVVVTAMMPGHSKVRALLVHFASKARSLCLVDFLREVRRSVGPLLGMLYYNIRMYALRREGGYRRFSKEELLGAVREAGFAELLYATTYGGRFHLVKAEAPLPVPANPEEGLKAAAAGPRAVCAEA